MIHVCLASDPPDGVGDALAELLDYQQEINKHTDHEIRVREAGTAWDNKTRSTPLRCLREVLKSMCSGLVRCMFCEDSCGDAIEHFRPKVLYPESVFDWANFLFACGKCNGPGRKGTKFSIYSPDGAITDVTWKRGTSKVQPPAGEPLLIHPRFEDPLAFLSLDLDSGRLRELDTDKTSMKYKRAKYTIELLDLNDREILQGTRSNVFGEHQDTLEKIAELKAAGANAHEIEMRKRRILERGHGIVWAEMKRSWKKRRDLQQLFNAVPEALMW